MSRSATAMNAISTSGRSVAAWPRAHRVPTKKISTFPTSGRMMSTRSGAHTSAMSVSRHDRPTRIATYTTMRLTFWSSDARAAVTVVFTWSVSLMTRARSWPPRVRWKKPSGSTWRCSNSWTRRSRTTPSWIAMLQTAAAPDREDHLLGRDAAVQERTAVARLVLAQLGGIDEEGVRRREQQPHPQPHRRQAERLQVLDRDRGLGVLAPQILAELVPQVRGRVALRVHGGGGLAVDRAVVRGEQHGDPAPLGLLERRQHRRALGPGAGQAPQRGFVARHLVQDRALRAAVGQLVHEVEHQRRHPVLREVGRQAAEEVARSLDRANPLRGAARPGPPPRLPRLPRQGPRLVRFGAPLAAHGAELRREQWGELGGRPVPVRYEKVFSSV